MKIAIGTIIDLQAISTILYDQTTVKKYHLPCFYCRIIKSPAPAGLTLLSSVYGTQNSAGNIVLTSVGVQTS